MKKYMFLGMCVFFLLLSGCTRPLWQKGPVYKTELTFRDLKPSLKMKYMNEPLLEIDDSNSSAQLFIDRGDVIIRHAYTDKTLLKKWDMLFEKFWEWEPRANDSITVSDLVDTKQHTPVLSAGKDVKFMRIGNEKFLVFITHQLFPFDDDIFAYDENNVIKMQELYNTLNTILVD